MEMPEGFEILKKFEDYNWQYRVKEALQLMKEMAEALEQSIGLIESEWGPISEEEKSGKIDRGGSKPFIALKKFKEWK